MLNAPLRFSRSLLSRLAVFAASLVFFFAVSELFTVTQFLQSTEDTLAQRLSRFLPGGNCSSTLFYPVFQYPVTLDRHYERVGVIPPSRTWSHLWQALISVSVLEIMFWIVLSIAAGLFTTYSLSKAMEATQRRALFPSLRTYASFVLQAGSIALIAYPVAHALSDLAASVWVKAFQLGASEHMRTLWGDFGADAVASSREKYPLWISCYRRDMRGISLLISIGIGLISVGVVIKLWMLYVAHAARETCSSRDAICLVCGYATASTKCHECGNDEPNKTNPWFRLSTSVLLPFFIRPIIIVILGGLLAIAGLLFPFIVGTTRALFG